MIKVTVELVSARGRAFDRLLGIGLIHNVGGDAARGDYHVSLSKMAPKERQTWKGGKLTLDAADITESFEGDVTNFDRQRRGCWDLLFLALRLLVGARNPAPEVRPVTLEQSRLRMPSDSSR